MSRKAPCDHDLRIWVDATTYLALHHLAELDDHSLSEYVRHVLLKHLRQESQHIRALASGEQRTNRDGDRR